jgi:hypothetical protein
MNTKEIILPDGWVIDKQEGNKLILKEDKPELNNWEKCFDKLNEFDDKTYKLSYINSTSVIMPLHVEGPITNMFYNAIPKEYAKPMLALMQLLVCYKAWVGDWKPDWSTDYTKYCIHVNNGELVRGNFTSMQHILAFPTLDIRDKFLETFKDLLEQAKPLI